MAEDKKSTSVQGKKLDIKKILIIVGISVDVVLTILLLILSILMLAYISKKAQLASATGFFGMLYYLMANPNVFLFAVVVPLFVLLVLNISLTVYYYQKIANKEKVAAEAAKHATLDSLTPEQKEVLRQQVLAELKDEKEKKTEEKKAQEKK